MIPFKLNMQILYDAFSDVYLRVFLHVPKDIPCLEAVRLYRKNSAFVPRYVYMLRPEELGSLPVSLQNISFICIGKTDICQIPPGCSVLIVEDSEDFSELFTRTQNIFEKYQSWNQELHAALSGSRPLDAMLEASLPIFKNPIFVHDTNFYILSCPHRASGMLIWDKDSRTGWNIIPLTLIHDFKTDTEYLNTLTTTEPALYSAEQRGYPILYMNIWNHGRYEGRVCVDELESPIRPGQYLAIRHLTELIVFSLQNHDLFQINMGNDIEQFFRDYLDGNIHEQSRIMKMLQFLNWRRNDRYLCLRLETSQQNIQALSSAATLGHIETQIPEGHAFIYKNGITVIVNLSYSHVQTSDVLSSLAILLREGLLKMGASSEIHDFMQLTQGCYQACIALELGLASASTSWCYRFDDYILEFFLNKGGEALAPELLCSNKILILKEYDENNHTDLYHTLKTFLELERNVLKTSKTLFIHRSTLFYRLERIQKIADVNLEDAKERLVLRLSFHILEGNED